MEIASPIELRLLSLVAFAEVSGRELAQSYRSETGAILSYGTLYTTIRRMAVKGWVQVRDDEDEDGRVRYIKIDLPGMRVLQESRAYYTELAGFGLDGRTA
jgi:DNA-binding PadR family transcriptional regulator